MILVTGATGNNGSKIVKQLSTAGAQVRALVRNRENVAAIEGAGVEIVEGDFDKPETLDAALEGVEKAFLVSSASPNMVHMQGNFIQAAQRAGTRHIVKLSTLGADPNAPITFGRWHGKIEKQLEESGIPFTHLQPSFFMQNMLGLAESIATQGVFHMPMKDGKVGMVDVRDIAAVAVKVLTEPGHEGKTYLITGAESLSFTQVAEKLSAAIGKKVTYVDVPLDGFKQGMVEAGQPEWLVDALKELYAVLGAGHGSVVTNIVTEVAKKQPLSFDQFARDFAPMFKAN